MNFSQSVLLEQGIIETILHTGVTEKELEIGILRASEISAEQDIDRYLVDASGASSFISLYSLYQLPKMYQAMNLSRSSRIAVVANPSLRGRQRARFFVNVCINRGWQAKLFYDRSEGMDWLGRD